MQGRGGGFTLVCVRTHTWCHDCLFKASREVVQSESRVGTCARLVNARFRSCQVSSSSARACMSSANVQTQAHMHHALQFSQHLYHISVSSLLDLSLARCHALSSSLAHFLSHPRRRSFRSHGRSTHINALEASHYHIRSIARWQGHDNMLLQKSPT
jgi:hypothetical protein